MNQKLFGFLIACVFLFSACMSNATVTESPTAAEIPVQTETATASVNAADECLVCHINKQKLIDTAKPVVAAEPESK